MIVPLTVEELRGLTGFDSTKLGSGGLGGSSSDGPHWRWDRTRRGWCPWLIMVDLVYAFRALDRSVIIVEVLAPDVAAHGAITVKFCVAGWTMFCHRSIIALPGLQNSLTVRSRFPKGYITATQDNDSWSGLVLRAALLSLLELGPGLLGHLRPARN